MRVRAFTAFFAVFFRDAGERLLVVLIFRATSTPNRRDLPYHRLSASRYIKNLLMNDFSRAPRVLVVEDDEDIAQALQRSLRMEGYEVRAALRTAPRRSSTAARSRPTS